MEGREATLEIYVAAIHAAMKSTWDRCVLVLEKVYQTETNEEIDGQMVSKITVHEVRYQVVKIQKKDKDKKRLAFFPSTSKSNRS